MTKKITFILTFFLITIWFLLFLNSFYHSFFYYPDNWEIWSLCFGLGILGVLGVIYVYSTYKLTRKYLIQDQLIQGCTAALGHNHEVVVFDEKGQVVYTTHPYAYPHQKEFFRKIMLRVFPSPEVSQFKNWIEECQPGTCLLKGGGNGLDQQMRWWLAHVVPLDPLQMNGKNFVLISLNEITTYIEGYNKVKYNYQQIENFIDKAPFGIFYLNKNKNIIGLNDTFSQWLGQSKECILGQQLSKFVDNVPEKLPTKPSLLTLNPLKQSPFKVLWFPPSNEGGPLKIQASFVCKIDQAPSSSGLVHMDLASFEFILHMPIPAIVIEPKGSISIFNPSFCTLLGENLLFENNKPRKNVNFFDIIDESQRNEIIYKIKSACERENPLSSFDIRFNEGKIHTTAYINIIRNPIKLDYVIIIQFIDSSEHKRLEQQFIQSQKMQAVGQLAGGIAHDFNNLLTAMIGFCDLLLQRYMPKDPSYMDIVQIKQNANRAANLVRQLLAFSRQQNLQPKVIIITDTLAELSALLRRLLGARIELQMIHGRDLWPVKVDASQLEQVIINLAVNARDAMLEGGSLIIRTGHYVCYKSERMGHDVMPAGDYVLIEVIDTGEGIKPEHLDHIFEPFFSTKEVGAGTGLGLSTVYGIVKQTGGFVGVESEIGNGTVFKIFLPRYKGDELVYSSSHDSTHGHDLTGRETILLVEDEDAVRLFSARALRDKGYKVIEAESGGKALELVERGQHFDLLVTDVVMPKMDGPTLSKKIRDRYPHIKTIFISGYTEDTFRKNLDHNAQIHFLQKPFTLKDLAQKVKEVLKAKDEIDYMNL